MQITLAVVTSEKLSNSFHETL